MTRVRKLNVSQVEGNDANNTDSDEIRPFGEIGIYENTDNGAIKPELLMFDGNRTHLRSKVLSKGTFYGGDADGGDGTGVDTIKLIPDAVLHRNGGNYGNDQYLIIDPTGGEPNHIHIRAGGTIDGSNTDLFLGGEKNNVRVSDINDRVTITTDFGVDGQTRTWTFNNNGGLQLPGSSNGLIGEDEPGVVIFSDLGFALVTNANTDSSKAWIFDGQGGLRLPGSATIENTQTVLAAGTIIEVPLNAAGDTVDYVGGASVLEIPKNTDTDQVQAGWIITFGNDVQRTVTGVLDGGLYWSVQYAEANPGLGASTYPLIIQSANYNEGSNGNITIGLNNLEGSSMEFVFDADGNLSLPSGITASGDVFLYSDLVFPSDNGGTISVATNEDLTIETSRYPTVSAEAIVGSSLDLLVVDISANDDITVVNTNWEINAGSEVAPEWLPVVSTDIVPGDICSINVPGFEFIAGFTYTFRNTTPLQTGPWEFTSNGTLVTPGGVIIGSAYQEGNPTYRDFSIEMLEPGDAFEHSWVFRNDATTELPGTLQFGDGTVQTTAASPVVQGEYTFDFDGINTDVTLTEVDFNLLYASTALGYSGSATHNINLPAGMPGQRLVIVNVSNFCTLTINNSKQITVASGPAEIIYSANDGWITLYGTV